MIYLIGGPPKCGKTTLAKRLADKYRISWISADTLENIVWAYISEEKRPSLFPHSSSREDSNDQLYSDHSAELIQQEMPSPTIAPPSSTSPDLTTW